MENNESIKQQNNIYHEKITELTSNVIDLKEKAQKFKELYQRLLRENEKLATVRDELQEQLGGFKKLQEMIFSQLNEKMKAMDRSLLEKIALDIEMIDGHQGLSRNEFDSFMNRVPTHLKNKFIKIAHDFQKFDKNKDDIIESDEFGAMLDQVMEGEGLKKT
ncbi:kinesin-related protein 4-like [Hydra vulgaris]|uniref:Kinesin-related protein 4-like n=2 Tax=Hydra vulgaris TaxID=6087 RepID=A0S5V5_HYDVU|nr:kinesin-related protein 4-like [Hydra vulgaris]ABC25043.1 hypothetical protein [Hydra vulgaris]